MLSGATQESLLALLAFDDVGDRVKALIPIDLWDRYYKVIAAECYGYWDNYRKPPGEHFLDLIERLSQRDVEMTDVLQRLSASIVEIYPGINQHFVLDQATEFVRHQRLRSAIVGAVDLLQSDDMDAAEVKLTEAVTSCASMLDLGVSIADSARWLNFLDRRHADSFKVGIPELDCNDLVPGRGELSIFVAPRGRGKSWWLVHLGKQALLQRLSVVHITLELSEEKTAQRYCQALFSVSKRPENLQAFELDKDELGRFVSFRDTGVFTRPSIEDSSIRKYLTTKLARMRRRMLTVKQFPTGSISLADIDAYLDSLWVTERRTPDILLLDYAALMHLSPKYYRLELGAVYKGLRGMAIKRNMAVVTAAQSNRLSETARRVEGRHVAEDISLMDTADVVWTYSQTEEEKRLKLARLYVAKCRNDQDGQTILVSQNYGIGQFCVSSARMVSGYWDNLKTETAAGRGVS